MWGVAIVLLIGCELQKIAALQAPYHIEVEGFKYVNRPNNAFQIEQLRIAKYNSTTNVINAIGSYAEDFPMDTMVSVKGYQLLTSNKYSMIPVGPPPASFCEFIETDTEFYPVFRTFTNLPEKCPIKKGTYWLKQFIPRFRGLPEQLPGERWRVDAELTAGKKKIMSIQGFVYINRNV